VVERSVLGNEAVAIFGVLLLVSSLLAIAGLSIRG
jgi:hypothetical protein